MIEGIGPEAEVVVNKDGGKESKAIGAFYLIEPSIVYASLRPLCKTEYITFLLKTITTFMVTEDSDLLVDIFKRNPETLLTISKVLEEGAIKYKPNNWRLIPSESHINHALCHLYAYLMEDKQDDHLAHCITRIMMAASTNLSKDFHFVEYKEKGG